MWDASRAQQYEDWFQTPKGALALRREQEMVAGMVSGWPRRGRSLLEIGCGAGHFLELFYGGGFDVTGIDMSQPMLDLARKRMGDRATLRLGSAERLPFDGGEFDYVALITALECMDDAEAALAEAFRVATHGVLVAFLNPWSPYRMEIAVRSRTRALKNRVASLTGKYSRRKPSLLESLRWFSPFSMYRLIRNASGMRPAMFRSVLFTPSFCWHEGKTPHFPWLHVLPFGAVAAMRVDMIPVTGTTMPLRTKPAIAAAQYPRAATYTSK